MDNGPVVLLNPPSARVQVRDFYCSVSAKANYCWAPIDLLVMSGRLAERGEVVVVDAIAEGLVRGEALRRVLSARPRAVISMSSAASHAEDAAFLRDVKEGTGARIAICGNVCLDERPWPLEESPWLDALVADFTTPSVVGFAYGGEDADLPGMAVRAEGGIRDERRSGAELALDWPTPRHELFPLARYRLPYARRYPLATITASYGCPYACAYCVLGRPVLGFRTRPLERVASELDRLRELGVGELYFRDPLFGADPRHARGLLSLLRERGFEWSCDCRVDTLTDELAGLMAESGCTLVAFGLETADEGVLSRQGKDATGAQARAAVERCRRLGIRSAGYFILGLPGETWESSLRTIDFAVDVGVDFASFSVAAPDYGTRLRREAGGAAPRLFDRNRVSPPLGALTEEQLAALSRRAALRFYGRPSFVLRALAGLRGPRQLLETAKAGLALARGLAA